MRFFAPAILLLLAGTTLARPPKPAVPVVIAKDRVKVRLAVLYSNCPFRVAETEFDRARRISLGSCPEVRPGFGARTLGRVGINHRTLSRGNSDNGERQG
jgi:hypothetical protein